MGRLTEAEKQQFQNWFLGMVEIESASNEDQLGKRCPTTDGQIEVANYIELILGMMDVSEKDLMDFGIDEHGYLMVTIPTNIKLPEGKTVPTVGLLAHMDTNPEGKGPNGVHPKKIMYQGGDIPLSDSGESITVAENPHLGDLEKGSELIITDGTSLLGGDDKAGIAEILVLIQHLLNSPEIPRPNIRIAFVPDEEIGHQIAHLTKTLTEGAEGHEEETVTILDRDKWPVDQAYTVDGGELGEINTETFNAVTATVTITGKLVHLMDAKKGGFVNAVTLTKHFLDILDRQLMPAERSEGREPHTTVLSVNGDMVKMTVKILLRGFEQSEIDFQKKEIISICYSLSEIFINGNFKMEFKDSYKNMSVYLSKRPEVVDLLYKAIRLQDLGYEKSIRGGTDGSRLSELGCPCPNIFTGTMNMHAVTEHLVLEWAYEAIEVLINLIGFWGEHIKKIAKAT